MQNNGVCPHFRMIDLHCHLLPGIDDGPETLEEALEMARIAVANGITAAHVTPHLHPGRWENDRAKIEAAVAAYRAALAAAGIALEIGFAAEVRLDYDILPLIEADRVPFLGTLEGYRVMLLEFPHSHVPVGADKFVAWLLARNIRPMIAHPERNKDLMRDPARLQPFVEQGCLLQVTADAVAGGFGELCATARARIPRARLGHRARLGRARHHGPAAAHRARPRRGGEDRRRRGSPAPHAGHAAAHRARDLSGR